MVQVYREPLWRRHYCSPLSAALCLRAVVLVGSVVLAFLLAFATGGFWAKASWELEQPTVHYSGDAVAVFESSQVGEEEVWASSPALLDALGARAASVAVQVGELDPNGDGRPDVIHFTARLAPAAAVHSVKLLLQFNYTLQSVAKVRLCGIAYVAASSPLPGAKLSVDGQLVLHQVAPLMRGVYSNDFATPLFGGRMSASAAALQAGAVLRLPDLLSAYAGRNLTTAMATGHSVWTSAGGDGSDGFVLDVTVRIPPHQLVLVKPSLPESLKLGWIQFLASFVAVWWLASRFEAAVFGLRVLETRITVDTQPTRGPKF